MKKTSKMANKNTIILGDKQYKKSLFLGIVAVSFCLYLCA